jgi:hypothetical protein
MYAQITIMFYASFLTALPDPQCRTLRSGFHWMPQTFNSVLQLADLNEFKCPEATFVQTWEPQGWFVHNHHFIDFQYTCCPMPSRQPCPLPELEQARASAWANYNDPSQVGNVHTLERIHMDCGREGVISSFKMEVAGEVFRWLFTCCTPNKFYELPCDAIRNTPATEADQWQLAQLRHQRVICPPSKFISMFGLAAAFGDVSKDPETFYPLGARRLNFRYRCCRLM